ncbi:hypothetical protein FRB90_006320 [Tulasnella sp. 427]|nr:hypothetical protein FRB90_006320 [Tulasnella sp. 427]
MHHTWNVPEILEEILKVTAKTDLPNMARVCRAFWPRAARLIWEVVPSITHWLALVPRDKEHSEHLKASEFEHHSISSEWERFRFYAAFVKDLTTNINHENVTSLLDVQSSSEQTVLFPNLDRAYLTLEQPLPQAEIRRVFSLLMAPNLAVLRCNYHFFLTAPDETPAAIIESLKLTPLIESFRFSGSMPSHIAPLLGPALSSMSQLRSIRLYISPGLPLEVVQAISQIPTLESVLIGVIQDPKQTPSLGPITYPSLKELRYVSRRDALRWILPTANPTIEAITAVLSGQSDINPFDALRPAKYPNLTTVNARGILNWDEITPLLAFKGLKELSITPYFLAGDRGHWSTSEARLLAESFPLLEMLVLKDGLHCFNILLTLPDLDCFAQHCPRLWYLGVSVDARAAHTFKGTVTQHFAIREVCLQESEVDGHEAAVADMIKRMWPNLQKGTRMYCELGEEPLGQVRSEAHWDKIWSLLDFAETDERFDYTSTKLYKMSQIEF